MRRFKAIPLILCLILLTACSGENPIGEITGINNKDGNAVTVYLAEMVGNDTMPVTQKLGSVVASTDINR